MTSKPAECSQSIRDHHTTSVYEHIYTAYPFSLFTSVGNFVSVSKDAPELLHLEFDGN